MSLETMQTQQRLPFRTYLKQRLLVGLPILAIAVLSLASMTQTTTISTNQISASQQHAATTLSRQLPASSPKTSAQNPIATTTESNDAGQTLPDASSTPTTDTTTTTVQTVTPDQSTVTPTSVPPTTCNCSGAASNSAMLTCTQNCSISPTPATDCPACGSSTYRQPGHFCPLYCAN